MQFALLMFKQFNHKNYMCERSSARGCVVMVLIDLLVLAMLPL